MTDKYKQIADCYGAGLYNDLYAKDVKAYVEDTAKDVHLMWDEIQRLRHSLERLHHLVQHRMLPEEDTVDRIYPIHSDEEIIEMVDKEVSRIRGTEDA